MAGNPNRECAECGKPIILWGRPTEYNWRIKDYRKDSPTRKRVLYFCNQTCMKEFDKKNPRKTYNRYGKG